MDNPANAIYNLGMI